MTTIRDALDMAVDSFRQQKEMRVAQAGDDSGGEAGNAFTYMAVYRGHEPVALIHMPPQRDHQLAVARVAASGYAADILSMAFETWTTGLKCNPVTNRQWRPGEITDVAENHRGREKGWVQDALQVMVVNRAGDLACTQMPYRPDNGTVRWGQPRDANMTGLVADVLMKIMNEVPFDIRLPLVARRAGLDPADLDLDPEQARHHIDCAITRFIAENVAAKLGTTITVVLHAEPGSLRAEIIRNSLGDIAQVIHPDEPPEQAAT